MNRLKIKQFVLAVTAFVFVVYSACAIFTLLAPEAALKLFGQWIHAVDLTKIASVPTVSGVFAGMITITLATIVASAFFVLLWNAAMDAFGGENGKK